MSDFNRFELVLWSRLGDPRQRVTMLFEVFTTKMTLLACAADHFRWPNFVLRPRNILLGDDLQKPDEVERVLSSWTATTLTPP